jgi:hypothetical protein
MADFERIGGGTAFPVFGVDMRPGHEGTYLHSIGLSKREWFAGMALVGMIAHPEGGGTPQTLADYAYRYADAMLKAGVVEASTEGDS